MVLFIMATYSALGIYTVENRALAYHFESSSGFLA